MRTRRSAKQIRVAELVANPANIRDNLDGIDELARSITENGILNPLLVSEDLDTNRWLLLAGHRRLAACRRAGLTSVPCFIHHNAGDDPVEQTVVMLVENVQRKNLTPLEKARAYGSLRNQGLNPSQIARRTGIHVSTVISHLALLDADDATLDQVEAGEIPAGRVIAVVREHRQQQRKDQGTPPRGRPIQIEPPYLTRTHPLAAAVLEHCTHTQRPRLGGMVGVGCGQCWEQVIREDERRATA